MDAWPMEAWIRLGAFFAIFAIMALWEAAAPCRVLSQSKAKRWTANLGLLVVDALAVRLTLGAAASNGDATRAMLIVELPAEILFKILSYMSFKEISYLRMVSQINY